MASYFVATAALPGTPASVHDRLRCAPGSFPQGDAEYLGEFTDVRQALAVARLRFPLAAPCACCAPQPGAAAAARPALSFLRP